MCACVSIGACHCQLLDRVIPGSVDMSKVKFDAQCEDDYRHNFSLLHDAFRNNSITTVSAPCLISDVTSHSVSRVHIKFLPILDLSSRGSNSRQF